MQQTHRFTNGQLTKDNDTSFPEIFPVVGYSYEFQLTPETAYWRFGLRFAVGSNYADDNHYTRYKNTKVQHVEVCVGRFDESAGWSLERRLEIVGYLPTPRENPLFVTDNYQPGSKVIVRLTWLPDDTVAFAVEVDHSILHVEPLKLGGKTILNYSLGRSVRHIP